MDLESGAHEGIVFLYSLRKTNLKLVIVASVGNLKFWKGYRLEGLSREW